MKIRWMLLSAVLWMMTGCTPVSEANHVEPDKSEATESSKASEPDQVVEITPTPYEEEVEDNPTKVVIEPMPTATDAVLGGISAGEIILVTPDDSMDIMIQKAKELLTRKLGIAIENIKFFDILAVEWPDSSLGCPQAGMLYADVITPGYKMQLEVNGSYYSIHSDTNNSIVLCSVEPPHEIYHPP